MQAKKRQARFLEQFQRDGNIKICHPQQNLSNGDWHCPNCAVKGSDGSKGWVVIHKDDFGKQPEHFTWDYRDLSVNPWPDDVFDWMRKVCSNAEIMKHGQDVNMQTVFKCMWRIGNHLGS
eukprot:840622-Amphidinium_carterae.1